MLIREREYGQAKAKERWIHDEVFREQSFFFGRKFEYVKPSAEGYAIAQRKPLWCSVDLKKYASWAQAYDFVF